jgi:hypothetical protein
VLGAFDPATGDLMVTIRMLDELLDRLEDARAG